MAEKKKKGLAASISEGMSKVTQGVKNAAKSVMKTAGNVARATESVAQKYGQKNPGRIKSKPKTAQEALESAKKSVRQRLTENYRIVGRNNIKADKWYQGDTPTVSETLAKIYSIADGDRDKFIELENDFYNEVSSFGSPIYAPYLKATNWKAIQNLQQMGYLEGELTREWYDANLGIKDNPRFTNTGIVAGAPTKYSSDEENASYWMKSIVDREPATREAEDQMAALSEEVAYLVNLGYSDEAVLNKIRNGNFSSKYGTLAKMDAQIEMGDDPLVFNRAINYYGDETIYGMIWAARNDGGSGDYLMDSTMAALGKGKKYIPHPETEAAHDPSSYEDYHPYYGGSNMHDINIKTGQTKYDQAWLDANRSMLNGTEEDRKTWQSIYDAHENTQKANTELVELNEWIQKQVERGYGAEEISSKLEAKMADKAFPTLAKMERERERGSYLELTDEVDFTLPRLKQSIAEQVEARDTQRAEIEAEESSGVLDAAKGIGDAVTGWFGDQKEAYDQKKVEEAAGYDRSWEKASPEAGGNVLGWLKLHFTRDVGPEADAMADSAKAAGGDVAAQAKQYIYDTFGMTLTGEMSDNELKAFQNAIDKTRIAQTVRTPEAQEEANAAASIAQQMFATIVADDKRVSAAQQEEGEESKHKLELVPKAPDYENTTAYKSLFGKAPEQPREGMTDGEFIPQSADGDAAMASAQGMNGSGQIDPDSELGQAVISMMQGGEWDSAVFSEAVYNSSNRAGLMTELVDGIQALQMGTPEEEVSGFAVSWWNKHQHLVSYQGMDLSKSSFMSGGFMGSNGDSERWDGRKQYGSAIYDAIKMNEAARDAQAITPDEYVENLMRIADVTDIVDGMAAKVGADKDMIAEQVFAEIPGQEEKIGDVYAACEAAMGDVESAENKNRQTALEMSIASVKAFHDGTATTDQLEYLQDVQATDISEAAKADEAYQEISGFLDANLTVDALRMNGVNFTTGSFDTDSMMDPDMLYNTGAMAYAQGVKGVAKAKLDYDLRMAAACDMTLAEYYQEFPEQAKSSEQLMVEAETEYTEAWLELGQTIKTATEAGEIALSAEMAEQQERLEIEPTEEQPGIAAEDSLTAHDVVALASDNVQKGMDLAKAKTLDALLWRGRTGREASGILSRKYKGDAAAYRADLEAYRDSLPEGDARRKHISTFLDSYQGNVFDYGMTVPQMKVGDTVSNLEGDLTNIQKTVEQYGTDGDKAAFEYISATGNSVALMGETMLLSAAGMSALPAAIIAAIPEGGTTTHDLMKQGVPYGAALVAGVGTTIFSGATEALMDIQYAPKAFMSKSESLSQMAKAYLANENFLKLSKSNPRAASRVVQSILYGGVGFAANSLGEATQEVVQTLGGSAVENAALNASGLREGAIIGEQELAEAGEAGKMGFLTSGALSVVGSVADSYYPGNKPMTDYKGDILSMAEAQLLPEYDGVAINAAIDGEVTRQAIHEAAADLDAINNSQEQAEVNRANEAVQTATVAAAEAEQKYTELESEISAKEQTFAELNEQMLNSDVFDEDTQKQMTALADELLEGSTALNDARADMEQKQQALETAKQTAQAAVQKVQELYDTAMNKAREAVRSRVIDWFFEGSSEDAKAAELNYLDKSAQLSDAKEELRSAKALLDMYRKGSARSKAAEVEYGRQLEVVDQLTEEVEAAKAAAEEAFAQTPEAKADEMMAETDNEAEAIAQEAEAAAAADPENAKKQRDAELARAKANAQRAAHHLEDMRKSAGERIMSADSTVREQAQQEYADAVAEAEAAQAAADEAQTAYDAEYSSQGKLQKAIDNFQQYSNEDLLLPDSENHEAAQTAYEELAVATREAKRENARRNMDKAKTEMNAADPDSVLAFKEAWNAVNETSASDENTTAQPEQRKVSDAQVALDAVGSGSRKKAVNAIKRLLDSGISVASELAAKVTDAATDNRAMAENIADQLLNDTDNASEITDILKQTAEKMWADARGEAKTGETTTASKNPIEIMRDLTSRIRVGYNPGGEMTNGRRRLPRAVQGFYDSFAGSITTRTGEEGDLALGLHEFGHAVQERLSGLRANAQMINNLSEEVRNSYGDMELDGEAVAEFVVAYMYDRDAAIRNAGQDFVNSFEDMLRGDRDLYKAITDAKNQIELWNNADTGSKIGSMTKDSGDQKRGRIGSWLGDTFRKIETAVFDLTAPADLVSRDFRKKVLYSMHASRRADTALTKFLIDPDGRNIGKSLAERFFDAGITKKQDLNEVSRYALALHALDRLAQGKPVFDPHEISEQELRDYVAKIKENSPHVVEGAKALTSFWNDLVDAWWVKTGMISQKSVDHMREMYPHYVPTFRVVGSNFKKYGGKSAKFQIREAVKGGSSLEVINPINSIVSMTQQMVSTVTHNQMMQAFHAEMQKGGLGMIAQRVLEAQAVQHTDITSLQTTLDALNASDTVDPELKGDAYAEMMKLQERWYGTGQNYGNNVVSGVDANGNKFFYQIQEGAEGLYGILSGMSKRADIVGVCKAVGRVTRAFTAATTGRNPLFAMKNAMRDIQSTTNTGTHSLMYADGTARFLYAMFRHVIPGSADFKEWQAMGGGDHTQISTETKSRDAGTVSTDVAKMLTRGKRSRSGDFSVRSTMLEKISSIMTFEGFNNAVENTSRFLEYEYGKHNRSTPEGREEAFMASQDVTTNFGTHGASRFIQNMNRCIPFMNATLQGLNKDMNIIKDLFSGDPVLARKAAPKVAKTMMNMGLTAALQYALLKMAGGNEDDEDYELLNQEMRTGNLIIPIPKSVMGKLENGIGFDRPYVRIPIAQGVLGQGMYAAALEMVSNMADYSPLEVDLWTAAKSILADSIPDGTVFQAALDTMNNRTWYGGEIESEYMQRFSAINRYDAATPQAIIRVADVLNISPAKLEYLVNQYSGFSGKIIMPIISKDRLNLDGEWTVDGAMRNLAYSVLSNYTIDSVSSNNLSADYSAAKELVDQIVQDAKSGKPIGGIARTADGYDAYEAALVLQEEFKEIDEEISAGWADFNDIRGSSTLEIGPKVNQMRGVRRNIINPLMQDALALFEEYKMQYIDHDDLAMEISAAIQGKRPIVD